MAVVRQIRPVAKWASASTIFSASVDLAMCQKIGGDVIKAFLSRPLWVQNHVGSHLLKLDLKLTEMGFEVRTVGENVTPFASPFDEVVEVIRKCDCAIVLGLPFLRVRAGTIKDKEIENGFALPSEWNQIEAAISLMLGKPTLMMLHRGVAPRGLFDRGAANVFIHEFHTLGPKWVEDAVPKLRDLKTRVLTQQAGTRDERNKRT